jgi:hypothetical protein
LCERLACESTWRWRATDGTWQWNKCLTKPQVFRLQHYLEGVDTSQHVMALEYQLLEGIQWRLSVDDSDAHAVVSYHLMQHKSMLAAAKSSSTASSSSSSSRLSKSAIASAIRPRAVSVDSGAGTSAALAVVRATAQQA